MDSLRLYSEPYSPTGNVTSEGVLNQLGRPKLDILAVLVRESVQNSWDARLIDNPPLRYGIAGWTLSSSQRELLNNRIFRERLLGSELDSVLSNSNDLHVLAIYDRGTEGLGGPTRADKPPEGDEP